MGCWHGSEACEYHAISLGLEMRSVVEVHSLRKDTSATANVEHAYESSAGVTIPFTTGAWG